MATNEQGLGWRDVAPETLWRLLSLAFGLDQQLPPPHWDLASTDAAFDLQTLLAWLYAALLKARLERHLSPAYRETEQVLGTVRGRPLLLASSREGLLEQGKLRCRFDALTTDRPRNSQFKAIALLALRHCQPHKALQSATELLADCVQRMAAISAARASLHELRTDPVARHEAQDAPLVELAAQLLQGLSATQRPDDSQLPGFDPDNVLMRQVFERAVAALLKQQLTPLGWDVAPQTQKYWNADAPDSRWLPVMRPDVVLTHQRTQRTVLVETKFTTCWSPPRFPGVGVEQRTLKPHHLYQLYSYVCSQPWAGKVTGLLVYPSVGGDGPTAIEVPVRHATLQMQTLELRAAAAWDETVARLVGVIAGG